MSEPLAGGKAGAQSRGGLPRYVIVSGPPASGKTTLAKSLAARLDRPLITKDTIKDELMAAFEVPDVEVSRRIGGAAVKVILAIVRDAPAAVLESVWHVSRAREDLGALDGSIVEVFCTTPASPSAGLGE